MWSVQTLLRAGPSAMATARAGSGQGAVAAHQLPSVEVSLPFLRSPRSYRRIKADKAVRIQSSEVLYEGRDYYEE